MRTRPSAFTSSYKVFFALFGSLAALGTTREAHACSPPLEPLVSLTGASVPVDGVVAGLLTCTSCTTEDLVVVDDQNTVIAGAFETTNSGLDDTRLFAWRPSVPFTAGSTYSVRAKEELTYFDSVSFQATAASTDAPTAAAALELYTYGTDAVVCREAEPPPGSCGNPTYAFYEKTVNEADIVLTLAGDQASQFAYRVTWSADGGAEVSNTHYSTSPLGMSFEGTPASVCYSLVALPLLGGEEIDLGSDCFETDSLGTLGVSDEIYGDVDATLAYCETPPEGYEDAWCDSLRDTCQSSTEGACATFGETCTTEDVDNPPDPPVDDDTTTGTEDGSSHADSNESSGGCSVASTHGSPASGIGFAGLLAFGATLLARRRRQTA